MSCRHVDESIQMLIKQAALDQGERWQDCKRMEISPPLGTFVLMLMSVRNPVNFEVRTPGINIQL